MYSISLLLPDEDLIRFITEGVVNPIASIVAILILPFIMRVTVLIMIRKQEFTKVAIRVSAIEDIRWYNFLLKREALKEWIKKEED